MRYFLITLTLLSLCANNVHAGKRYDVKRPNKSAWHTYTHNGKAATVQYESLGRPSSGVIQKDGAKYILVIKSGGRVHRAISKDHFGATGGSFVGYAGSKDKAIALLNVSGNSAFRINTGDSSMQLIRIKTVHALSVISGSAIDDELVKGDPDHNSDDRTTMWASGKATNAEFIEHRRVEAINNSNNFFTLYADDESSKPERVTKFGNLSTVYWYGGDDSAYLLNPGKKECPSCNGTGNGAILHIRID